MNTSSNIPLNNQRTGGGTNATHIATMANASSDSSNKNNMVVPASRPLQWPSATAGLTVLQQQRLQMDFEEKRKLLEAQQKSKLGELQNKLKAQMIALQQRHEANKKILQNQQRVLQQHQAAAAQAAAQGGGTNGTLAGWQSDRDMQERRGMIQRIVRLLQQRKPNAPEDWIRKLPVMAKRLEESLYRNAASFEEYNDANTLKQRLQRLAMNIGYKTQHSKLQQQMKQQQQQQEGERQSLIQQQQRQLSSQQQTFNNEYRQILSSAAGVAGSLVKRHQAAEREKARVAAAAQAKAQQQRPAQPQLVDMSAINPSLVSSTSTAQAPSSNTGTSSSTSTCLPVTSAQHQNQQQQQAPGRTQADRQQVLRHQQQRLLLLRHAAKCPHEGDEKCPVTPHCSGMKKLWKHIAECKNQKCLVPHCVSSRYVLSHYHRCKDVRCPVCGPVREAIHRSHEKAKAMQRLKNNHDNAKKNSLQHQQQPAVMSGNSNISQQPGISSSSQPAKKNMGNVVSSNTNINSNMHVAQAHAQQPIAKRQRTPAHQVKSTTTTDDVAVPLQAPTTVSSAVTTTVASNNIVAATVTSKGSRPSQQLQQPKNKYIYAGSKGGISKLSSQAAHNGVGPKPQEDHTLINCFTVEQIETHINSLYKGLQLSPAKLKAKCGEVLKVLSDHQHGWVFNAPVDPVELQLPDYFQIIKNPMDLGTIRKRLDNGCYHSLEEFESDVNLTFDNAMLYNAEGSVVHNMASEMKSIFRADFDKAMRQINAEAEERRKKGDACSLCGCEKLLFEPPIYYCNGVNCSSSRIRRNSYYYTGNANYHWCHVCYADLKEDKPIVMADATFQKKDLIKKKNDDVHEESWVMCDKCDRWIHQICALFNTRQNKDQQSEYTCPRCCIAERKRVGKLEPSSTTPMAGDLERSKLSEYLEENVRHKVKKKFEQMAKEKSEVESIPFEEAMKSVGFGGPITIRQITSTNRKLEVRDRMKRRYAHKNYPSEFNYRCKMIIVFQNLDGVDVILFGIYFYEHGVDNPSPNTRTVYISYLDSVHYMRPRKMRTFVYHEILIAYLNYVRQRGFASAHIWACPPLKGDDYILFCKPEDQKTPREDRLRQWYIDMLVECQVRGIVGKLTNMYDLYFSNPEMDASMVPYFEGDYFISEVENIIKDLEGGGKKGSSSSSKSKKSNNNDKKKKKKGNGSRSGTRSSGIDEDALADSGIMMEGMDVRSLKEGGRDYVMKRTGEIIKPMKESFIVAYLNWEGATEDKKQIPLELQEKRSKYLLEHQNDPPSKVTITPMKSPSSETALPKTSPKPNPGASNGKDGSNTSGPSKGKDFATLAKSTAAASAAPKKEEVAQKSNTSLQVNGTSNNVSTATSVDSSKKRGPDGSVKCTAVKSSSIKVIDDDEEEMECEFLNNRQAFLNLCQGNHYQFDQLRRAKHTSMMVLWHLHNRDAPKFVQQCASCSREILSGYRYHCNTCNDYDICYECWTNPNIPRHPHQLQAIPVNTGEQKSQQTDAQRRERQRNIQLHLQLLRHAATCTSPTCHSANCMKMKGIFRHASSCPNRANGSCHVCKRIWMLFQIHARQCKETNCKVPNCNAIREKLRQLKKQQQAMDDRRRQEMNRAYRTGTR